MHAEIPPRPGNDKSVGKAIGRKSKHKQHVGPNLVITQIGIGKMRMPRITVENKQ